MKCLLIILSNVLLSCLFFLIDLKDYYKIFVAVLLEIIENWKQHILSAMAKWINRLWYILTMEYYMVATQYYTTAMNLLNTQLN